MIVLAVDPGRAKCGIAVVDGEGCVLYRKVVPSADTSEHVHRLFLEHRPDHLIIGGGTGSKQMRSLVESACPEIEPVTVEEKFSTLDARKLYFQENPPGGIWRLVPRGFLYPKEPIDDYAAVVLARQFIEELRSKRQ